MQYLAPHHSRRLDIASPVVVPGATIVASGEFAFSSVSTRRRVITMKRLIVCAGLLVASTALLAQGAPKSPAAKESATIGGHAVTITYSSPRVDGREGKIFTKDGLISQNPHYP